MQTREALFMKDNEGKVFAVFPYEVNTKDGLVQCMYGHPTNEDELVHDNADMWKVGYDRALAKEYWPLKEKIERLNYCEVKAMPGKPDGERQLRAIEEFNGLNEKEKAIRLLVEKYGLVRHLVFKQDLEDRARELEIETTDEIIDEVAKAIENKVGAFDLTIEQVDFWLEEFTRPWEDEDETDDDEFKHMGKHFDHEIGQ